MSPQAQETLEQKNVQPSTPSNQMLQLPKCTLYLTKETFFPTNTHINFSAPRFLSLFTANANGIRFASIARLSVNPNVVVSIGPKKSAHDTALRLGFSLCMQSFTKAIVCATAPHFSRFGPSSFLRRNRPRKGSFEKGTLCRFVQVRTSGLGPCL